MKETTKELREQMRFCYEEVMICAASFRADPCKTVKNKRAALEIVRGLKEKHAQLLAEFNARPDAHLYR